MSRTHEREALSEADLIRASLNIMSSLRSISMEQNRLQGMVEFGGKRPCLPYLQKTHCFLSSLALRLNFLRACPYFCRRWVVANALALTGARRRRVFGAEMEDGVAARRAASMEHVMNEKCQGLNREGLAMKGFVRAEIAELRAEVRLGIDGFRAETGGICADMAAMETCLTEKVMGLRRWLVRMGATMFLALMG